MTTVTDPEAYEEKILHRFVGFAGKHVLEVGCGDGRLTWKYADTAQHVTGFDPDMDELRFAFEEYPYEVEGRVEFAQASARHIPFPRETFDIAILAWSL